MSLEDRVCMNRGGGQRGGTGGWVGGTEGVGQGWWDRGGGTEGVGQRGWWDGVVAQLPQRVKQHAHDCLSCEKPLVGAGWATPLVGVSLSEPYTDKFAVNICCTSYHKSLAALLLPVLHHPLIQKTTDQWIEDMDHGHVPPP